MNLPNIPPIPPANPFAGAPAPSTPGPAPAPPPSQANPVPAFPAGQESPAAPAETLSKRQIMPLLPQQLPTPGAESLLNPARILALITQGMVKPKNEGSTPDASKTATGQRDEAGAKGDSGKGADIVKIQVFKPEDANQNQKLPNKDTPKESDQPSSDTPAEKDAPKSESKASKADKQELPPQGGKEIKSGDDGVQKSTKEASSESPQAKSDLPSEGKQAAAKMEKSPNAQESPAGSKEGLARSPEAKQGGENPLDSFVKEGDGDNKQALAEKSSDNIEKSFEELQLAMPEPSSISTEPDRHQEAVQLSNADESLESPDRIEERAKDKEQVETVQRDDKFQNIEHPAGHRVLEHGKGENRSDFAAAQAPGGEGSLHAVHNDKAIPPWIAVLFQEQQEQQKLRGKGRGGSHKQSAEAIEYRLSDLLFMLLAASVCGCKTIDDYIRFLQSRAKWFKVVLGGQFDVPSKELVWKFLSSLNPANYQYILSPWLEEVCGHSTKLKNQEGKPVLPAISIWQSPIGLMMGQAKSSDPHQDRLAIPSLLQLFNLQGALVGAKSASPKLDISALIEKAKADFLVEIKVDSSAVEEIIELIDAAAKKKSQLYSILESYIEGQDRMIVEALKIDKSYRLSSYPTHGDAALILKVYTETVISGASSYRSSYFLSNLTSIDDEIFDLLRIQKPLERKVAWLLNCLSPPVPMSFAMQQCQQNMLLFRQFAISLLQRSGGRLSLDEKMHSAARNNEELLKFLGSGTK